MSVPSGALEATPRAALATRAASLLGRWVALWDEREPATILALIRISLALVVLVDLASAMAEGAVPWLWAPAAAGGASVWDAADAPLFCRVFPATAASAQLLWGGLALSMLCVGLGCCTGWAAVAHVCLSVQTALINGPGDRAIDRFIRIVLLILVLSPAGKVWSLDARWRTGSFRGERTEAPAWPRYLILGQLVLTYCGAGLAKGGTPWYPWGGYRALYLTLQDPILAAANFRWVALPIPYLATQLATALTHLWELAAPLVLVAAYYRRGPERGARLPRLFQRLPVRNVYVAVGIVFHLTLAATLRLGIFPFAMLACFPAFFRPDELAQLWRWLRRASPRRDMSDPPE